MSSFKRKGSAKHAPVLPGTRPSPASSQTIVTSTGISSLDDILGGGLPLSCSMLVAAPDLHSSYGDLVNKYFIAQGLVSRHRLLVVDDDAASFVRDIMWTPTGSSPAPDLHQDGDEIVERGDHQGIKIAWRYEGLKPFQTTVSDPASSNDDYCHNFDLGSRVPSSLVEKAFETGQLLHLRTSTLGSSTITAVLSSIRNALESEASAFKATRICVPLLGSPMWGELKQQDIVYFLHSLRAILRQNPTACALIHIAPHLCTEAWGGRGWLQRLAWVSDAAFTLAAFSADPSLTTSFPNHHGLLHIHTLPAPHSIVPPSDKFSTLRGLSASAGGGGGGENNLTFKSTRKRLIFETLHLDIEGGVGERRTAPPATLLPQPEGGVNAHKHDGHTSQTSAFAAVQVVLEGAEVTLDTTDVGDQVTNGGPGGKPKKSKKKVAFRADRPDLRLQSSQQHSAQQTSSNSLDYWRVKALPAMPKEPWSGDGYSGATSSRTDGCLDEQREDEPTTTLPSPTLSSNSYGHVGRPRAQTLHASEDWSDSPSLSLVAVANDVQTSFQRPPMPHLPLPDPSQFPDPYPFRPPHHHLSSVPALSSAGSSSTRSSAYTSSASRLASGDYEHIHVASGEDDSAVGVGITSDAVVQLLANDPSVSPSARPMQSRAPIDQSRWSESYSSRSRSSSVGPTNSNNPSEYIAPTLHQKPSYDMGWVDERDEVAMSEEETDDDHPLGDDEEDDEKEEERTSAVVVAEEGRGLIVQGGNLPIVQLQVPPGTTHLLIGSSSTPNAMPAFLTNTLPQICHSLLALDISANFLGALPPVLAVCERLEELNVAFNPLRVLPVFLADLSNLRVIIADSTGISTLPESLADLEKLHTISVRKNKLHALSSWLCLLPSLKTLCVDGNPFQGPWKALVEPLLTKVPMSPAYPPSTPLFPAQAMSMQISTDTEDSTDIDDLSDFGPPSAGLDEHGSAADDEDHTITPARAAPVFGRSVTAPLPAGPPMPPSAVGLTRTRTTPNRAHFEMSKAKTSVADGPQDASYRPEEFGAERELRKMKSAGDLRRGKTTAVAQQGLTPGMRPALSNYTTSVSSSNLLTTASTDPPGMVKRYATMGPGLVSGNDTARPMANGLRPQLTRSMWDTPPQSVVDASTPSLATSSASSSPASSPAKPSIQAGQEGPYSNQYRPSKDGKEKGSRWGFLKKMSMGKMKIDAASINQRTGTRSTTSAGPSSRNLGSTERSKTPQIDLRFSTTGMLDVLPPQLTTSGSPPDITKKPSPELLSAPPPPTVSSLLVPPPSTRAAKRRSFLPIEAPGTFNIPSQESSAFIPALTPMSSEDDEQRAATPVVDNEQHLRREEERAREAYNRALRSVMAYLKDMNDLGLSQQAHSMSVYGTASDDNTSRSRRPTIYEGQREVSMALTGSTGSSDSNGLLRSVDSIVGPRSGNSAQTLSIATTDSAGSSEERKFKDDKGKRAMIVREIVATERTYVKGLQELMDIYIKPSCDAVNILSGVGSNKDTVVPAAERKLVFGGIDALFSFHKDSFLPALEIAASPLLKSTESVQLADTDGQLSLNVVKAVGSMFLKHAAFMRMYSSYINNFDNAVLRVKYWTSERNAQVATTPGASTISPSSSTGQLSGLTSASPGPILDAGPAATGVPNLTSSQRKRIRSYLKRCRLSPRHSQLNLEGYLLLPVQRIPRYRLLLEELLRSTPPTYEYEDDPLERALVEISSLANNMNEGKRESESRRKLVQWQSRIRGRFPSPLVQPHRRLIMDGPLLLTRVVRKAMVSFEAINPQGDASTVQVDCLAPELTPRALVGILCNDLLVLCRDPSEGQDPSSYVDLWAVLRMQTLPQPASIVHGNALRLVDNKAILYFDAPSPSDALNWYRAINLHIPASKT
ncbi:hypothetical protein H0H93_008114 [Arthromyces matolae]|nr:hypothetical protein H0H93_008114 [Arthromyces matolae]